MDIPCAFSVQPSHLNNKQEQRKVSEVVSLLILAEVNIYFDICICFVELSRSNNEAEEQRTLFSIEL
jgi:hypothetical protein